MDNCEYTTATLILVETSERLRALGLHFTFSRFAESPHGQFLSLHVAASPAAAAAGEVATGHGVNASHVRETREGFAAVVSEVIKAGFVNAPPDWAMDVVKASK